MNKIAIVSPTSLEDWSWKNPKEKGIGGSETSHCYMTQKLAELGFNVESYAPIPEGLEEFGPAGVRWRHFSDKSYQDAEILIVYRSPEALDFGKKPNQRIWFVAQDVAYQGAMTPERLAKIDRYLALSPVHVGFTKSLYPELHESGRLFQSANGIDSAGIKAAIAGIERQPRRMMYASSADRGLKLILENWFRIRERVPDAELVVAYGFDNMEKIVKLMSGNDWRAGYQKELEELLKQPGITVTGRIGQDRLWEEMAKSNIWFYPCDFPETFCCQAAEQQACGAIPVTTNFWALRQNVLDGYKFDSTPQASEVVRSLMIEKVIELLEDSSFWDIRGPDYNEGGMGYGVRSRREEMQEDASDTFDWGRVADQWQKWIDEDLAK